MVSRCLLFVPGSNYKPAVVVRASGYAPRAAVAFVGFWAFTEAGSPYCRDPLQGEEIIFAHFCCFLVAYSSCASSPIYTTMRSHLSWYYPVILKVSAFCEHI